MHWYLDVLKKYAVFSGRARRAEYWIFVLVNAIITFVLTVIDHVLGLVPAHSTPLSTGLLSGIYLLAVLVPSLAVQCRRLHDTDRRGWWMLLSLIPIIGSLVLLVFNVMPGKPGPNRFGPDPKGAPDPSNVA